MLYISEYASPLGKILMSSDGESLSGLWFDRQKYSEIYLSGEHLEKELAVFAETRRWLDIYFSGREPDFCVPLRFSGSDFQKEVCGLLLGIPYGKSVSYGELARVIARRRGVARMSAQAVGGAVGRNGISIIVPCHRVLGADGSLTGYAGGVEIKRALLELEGIAFRDGRQRK